MSYRMIIADDEEMLMRLILHLGHFKELGIEVVCTCRDGGEAYDAILREKPDFVLTDIQMPVMDGLEVIEKSRAECPNTLFVLLSGYRLFEYAQSAVHLNVVDYLLKPVDEEQLNIMLARLCRLTDERRQQSSDRESLENYRKEELQRKQSAFWQYLCSAAELQSSVAAANKEKIMEQYGMELPGDRYQILILNCGLTFEREAEEKSFCEKLDEISRRVFAGKATVYAKYEFDFYEMVLNFSSAESTAVNSACAHFLSECCSLRDVFGNFRVHLAQSRVKENAGELPAAQYEVALALWARFGLPDEQRITADYVDSLKKAIPGTLFTPDLRKRLTDSLSALDAGASAEVFAEMKAFAKTNPRLHPACVSADWKSLAECILPKEGEPDRQETEPLLNKARQDSASLAQLIENTGKAAATVITVRRERLNQKNRRPVEEAQAYIRKHYGEALSQESVAQAVGVSPAYLSRIFKELAGVNFSDFLTEVRMKEAGRLMASTRMPVRDVAAAVGYFDEKYFSKLFRQQYGLKPTDYRKLYG